MSQQYSLRWNNHQPNFISMFTNLLNTQTLVDVTLAAEGKHLQAHKVVLSACSSYFQALFVDNPSRHPIVILKDVSFADLRTMVDFMYYGEVNVTEEQLPQVLDTAKHLKIKGLTEMPDSTSLTRSQGNEFTAAAEDAHNRLSVSPPHSPTHKRRRRRKSSSGSTCVNMVGEAGREDGLGAGGAAGGAGGAGEMPRADSITLSSVPRRRDYHDERALDAAIQTNEQHNMNMEPMGMDANAQITQGGQWSMMEHTYPRYGSCLGGGMQQEQMYGVLGGGGGGGGNGAGAGGGGAGDEMQFGGCEQAPPEPPPPAQQKRRRTTNPQAEENFQRALEAVRFGGIGFCKAARMFGVNNRTLWLEYKKKGYPNNRPSIKNRIKREHTTPPPDHKEEPAPPEPQMALLCPPHAVPVSFMESRPLDFPLQGVAHSSPLNLLGVNFGSMQ